MFLISYPRSYPTGTGDNKVDEDDYNAIVAILDGFSASGTFKAPFDFLISKSGADYYVTNAYQIVYGGSADAGGVDGGDFPDCLNAALTNGDAVMLAPNTTFDLDSQITINANNSLIAFDHTSLISQSAGVDSPLHITGANVLLHGFAVDFNDNLLAGSGIAAEDVGNITLSNLKLTDSDGHAIFIDTTAGTVSNIKILNNYIYDHTKYCIQVRRITDSLIAGNFLSNNQAAGVGNYGAVNCWTDTERVRIVHNAVINNGEYGINTPTSAGSNVIAHNIVDTAYFGIRVNADNTTVADNYITTCTDGIEVYAVASSFSNILITGNRITDCAQWGIYTGADAAQQNSKFIIRGNHIDAPSDDTKRGMLISRATDFLIADNYVGGYTGAGGYGLDIGTGVSSDYIIVTGNNFRDNTNPMRTPDGAHNIIRNNLGYVTENGGTATITSPATVETVTHNCSFTPDANDITVTLLEDPTNSPGAIWVDNIGANTFDVSCENDPGASNLDFAWSVRKILG